jgi:hypothetical protein
VLFGPIQNGGEAEKAKEKQVTLFVAGADAPKLFGSLKEVFDLMPFPMKAAMPPTGLSRLQRGRIHGRLFRRRNWARKPPLS